MVFIFMLLATVSFAQAMQFPQLPVVYTIKDAAGTPAIITDEATWQALTQLSGTLREKTPAHTANPAVIEYAVDSGLTKPQLDLLLQIKEHKTNILREIAANRVSLHNITRTDIQAIKFVPEANKFFDNLLILHTQVDNKLTPVEKDIITYFSKTVKDFLEDFGNIFIMPVGNITQDQLIQLYNLIWKLDRPTGSSYLIWRSLKNAVKQNGAQLSSAQLLPLLQAANFLALPSYVLGALYELYKNYFSAAGWQVQETTHPFLLQLEEIIYKQYPSIAWLLKKGIKFYTIQEAKDKQGMIFRMAKIEGHQVALLRGIDLIPGIGTCQAIDIRNTNIEAIEMGDLSGLSSIKFMTFGFNKLLTILEPHSFNLQNLTNLRIAGSNITELSPGIFELPALEYLEFNTNHLRTIKNRWGFNLPKVFRFILNERELTTLEHGWLTGLLGLQELSINPNIPKDLITQIQNDLANSYLIRFGAPPPTLTFASPVLPGK